jgi:hypothetical protein
MSLHDIRWGNEMLTSLLIDLGEARDIRITVNLGDSTYLSTVSCRCLLRIFLCHHGGLLNFLRLLAYDIQHTSLKALFVSRKEVLLPIIIVGIWIEIVSFHALLEQAHAIFIIRLLFEFQLPTVSHIIVELLWLSPAQFFEWHLELLLFNVLVFFILVLSGQSLPGQTALDEI